MGIGSHELGQLMFAWLTKEKHYFSYDVTTDVSVKYGVTCYVRSYKKGQWFSSRYRPKTGICTVELYPFCDAKMMCFGVGYNGQWICVI